MCGITGVLSLSERPINIYRLKAMTDVIAHRGPDDAGYLVWQTGIFHPRGISFGEAFTDTRFSHISPFLLVIDSEIGKERLAEDKWDLFLGHRRLAIIDLSARGHQPMSDKTHHLWLTYNGEIYNFIEIKSELKTLGHNFSGDSDTEVLLHAYDEWGIECVKRFNGMFAFALWDDRKKQLHLARDRYGIKPLYYYYDKNQFIFGSEIKSILKYLQATPVVDLLALNEYFSFQNIFSDRTLFSEIKLLPAAHILTIHRKPEKIAKHSYWDFSFKEEWKTTNASEKNNLQKDNLQKNNLNIINNDLQEELYHLIVQAVKRQCIADVPIGAYLSGGMDSGTVTALTVQNLGRINTFTGGFDLSEATERETIFDEREMAERMASLFQTEHYECVLHAGDIEAVMDRLIWHLEDLRVGQCYPNYYMAGLAGKFVKVVMSGAGGDELFGGYPWRYAAAIGPTDQDFVANYYHYWQRLVRNLDKPKLFQSGVVEKLKTMNDQGAQPFKDHTLKIFGRVFGEYPEPRTIADQVNKSLYFECKTFLHGLLLVEDKISMAHSLETRVPLLDNDLVDFASKVPVCAKISGLNMLEQINENELPKKYKYREEMNSGKNILRQTMARILPKEIINAKKQGFSAPDESWFRGKAEDYVRSTLLGTNIKSVNYLNTDFLKKTVEEHSTGKVNHRLLIWSMLCFEKWLNIFHIE